VSDFDTASSIIEVVTSPQLGVAERAHHAPVVPCELPDGIRLVYADDRGRQHTVDLAMPTSSTSAWRSRCASLPQERVVSQVLPDMMAETGHLIGRHVERVARNFDLHSCILDDALPNKP
jgi:hypothetical protein